jgi:hypothetical protein
MGKNIAVKTADEVCAAIEQCISKVYETAQGSQAPIVDWYVQTYPDILAYFADLTQRKAWTPTAVRLGFLIVYGWMPTTIRSFDHEKAAALASHLNERVALDAMVELVAKVANNSMVGGSKFLHFYDPENFPITDSVLQMLTGKPSQYRENDVQLYRIYCEAVERISETHRNLALKWASAAFDYEVSVTRAIEALCFYAMKQEKSGKVCTTAMKTRSVASAP